MLNSLFPAFFQWFVLLSTLGLAVLVARSLIVSFLKPRADGADGADGVEQPENYDRPPFYTVRQPVFWHIIILAALSRIILYGIAFLSSRIYLHSGGSFLEMLPELWQRSDAPHYVSIAENWYVAAGEDRVFLVFLPLYPIVIKLFSFVLGDAVFSGILISVLSFMAACVLFYEVALLIGQDADTAYCAVKYAIFFPASFFINGAFSEGMFLLFSAFFFHCLLRKKWLAAGISGFLASFTRYYGLLLIIPFTIELAQNIYCLYAKTRAEDAAKSAPLSSVNRAGRQQARNMALPNTVSRNTELRKSASPNMPSRNTAPRNHVPAYIIIRSLPILLIPAGTGLFLIINYAVSGNFFQFLIYQREHWNQQFSFFFVNMRVLAENAFSFDKATSATLFTPQIISILLFIALMAFGVFSKFRASFLAYLGVYFLISISAYWMLSFPRYIFGAVPMFPLMASLGSKSRAADALVSLICIAGLIFFTIAYTCGFHVY